MNGDAMTLASHIDERARKIADSAAQSDIARVKGAPRSGVGP